MLRLLCIIAHPDDETGAFGGSLLKYGKQGVETHVICLTPGQAAAHRGGAGSDAELAAIRRREFAASCRILGVTRHEVLDHPDARLDSQSFLQVTAELTHRIRQIRPQVVMTFGSEGALTTHPDHTMTSHFATAAFHWAGRSNRFTDQLESGLKSHRAQKLYYATAAVAARLRQPVCLAPLSASIDVSEYLKDKLAAFRAHASQAPLFPLFARVMRKYGSVEFFHLAASTEPGEMRKETDLFDRVAEER
jgi:LmbE family N-acetylglucosaminyl deacetylase